MIKLIKRLLNIRLVSFMVVGGIGYIVNLAFYYPLTLLFKSHVLILGQQFYLPPLVVSTLIAITSNYYLNKIYTFKKYKESNQGYLKYLGTCLITFPLDVVFVWVFVQYFNFIPTLALAIAILCVFLIRFAVISRFVWGKKLLTSPNKYSNIDI
jgi:putative flippase GtrA